MKPIKEKLYHHCQAFVSERLHRIQQQIKDQQEALTSETKSSAGDKHETGRAMLHLEREKTGQQLAAIQQLQQVLAKINPQSHTTRVALGSLVYTTQGTYYISISIGKLIIAGDMFYAIAANTPIGKELLGKTTEESFVFNAKSIDILEVY